jgi:hypothetical protein
MGECCDWTVGFYLRTLKMKKQGRQSEIKYARGQRNIGHVKCWFVKILCNGRMNSFSLFLGQDCGCGRLWAGPYYLSEQ